MSSPATSAQLKPDAPFSLDLLAAAVRPEFAVECYFPDPDDPVLGGGRCAVASCSRLSWVVGCAGATTTAAPRRQARPHGVASAATPARPKSRGAKDPVLRLRPLGERARLELAYALQSRHDARVSARAARRWPGRENSCASKRVERARARLPTHEEPIHGPGHCGQLRGRTAGVRDGLERA